MSLSDGGPLDLSPLASRATLSSFLEAAARGPRCCVFVDVVGRVSRCTYHSLWQRSANVASHLMQRGLGAGSFALLQLPEQAEFLQAIWGCLAAGVVPVPVAPAESARGAARLLAIASALPRSAVLASGPFVKLLREQGLDDHPVLDFAELNGDSRALDGSPRVEALSADDDIALLLPTSGSSGIPKLVALTHREIARRTLAYVLASGLSEQHTSLNWMPLDHVGGLVMFHIRDVYLACDQVQVASSYVTHAPLRWLDLIQEHGAKVTWAPNFAFRAVLDALGDTNERRWDLSSLTHWISGGEMIVRATLQEFCRRLASSQLNPRVIRPAWGMSETSSGVTENAHFDVFEAVQGSRPVSVGPPIPGVAIRIVGEAGQLEPEGKEGRLEVKGAGLTAGYWGDRSRTVASFTDDGWFKTGDVGIIVDGALTISAREDEMIIVNGLNVHPAEIEEVARNAAGVDVVFTVACRMRNSGADTDQFVIFFVRRADRTDLRAKDDDAVTSRIREEVLSKIGVQPAYLVALEERQLPRTDTGKIQRNELRRRFDAGAYGDARPSRADTSTQITGRVRSEGEARQSAATEPLVGARPASALSREALDARLLQHLATVLGVAPNLLDASARFDQLGLTSMDGLLFRDAVERDLEVSITPGFTWHHPTLNDLAAHLMPRLARSGPVRLA